ncbi:histidine kinase [Natrarchaeobius halalkaliphilus]|uniref:Histidine kinase n=1 Tax=Natrarchaeobius halalkaliphilus TaxID=1679091 RepID=A0A3N6M922_9EURY|nr:histidine kinase [Natrarchaeobius halalkaliphilus]RQG92760.1 histidine kinase [Natrarchaeobius halalkaliphilus]
MTLRSHIEDVGSVDHALAVIDTDVADPLTALLAETFDWEGIEVETEVTDGESSYLEGETDAVALLEDGALVATSTMTELYESILAINSDLFVTGSRTFGEIDVPDVLEGLDDSRLRLRGYPLADKEKLVLILVSRYIEQLAWSSRSGTLRSSFQHLSRLNDEVGTNEVYARLEETNVDVHVYGFRGSTDLDVTAHLGSTTEHRDGWFVIYDPDDPSSDDAAALVCLEVEPRVWDGFFTFDAARTAALEEYIAAEL